MANKAFAVVAAVPTVACTVGGPAELKPSSRRRIVDFCRHRQRRRVAITNAVVDVLPPGVVANELLVDNGARSFSVILSAPEDDLQPLWDEFIASVEVT